MRTTTKIVLGIILSIFILAIGLIIGFSLTDRIYYSRNISGAVISRENMQSISVEPYKTIVLDWTSSQYQHDYNIYLEGKLTIKPANNNDVKENFSFPEELSDYFMADSANDTLFIKINKEKLYAKYEAPKNQNYLGTLSGFIFEVNTNNVDVINNIDGIHIAVKDIDTDSISIVANSNIFIENCKADVVEPIINRHHKNFELKDSRVKKLNLDLDRIGNWSVVNCEIEEENLTGSGKQINQLISSETKVISWQPKNKDAELVVILQGDTTRIIFP